MSSANSLSLSKKFVAWQVDRLLAVLAAMFFLPMVFHVLPVFKPGVGMIWLPIFYAPLVAVIYCRPHVGLVSALIAPSLNSVITGFPEGSMVWMLTIDLLLFIMLGRIFYDMFKKIPIVGICSYIGAKFISVVVLGILPVFLADLNRVAAFWRIISGAVPGLLVLLLINGAISMQKREESRG